MEGTITAVAKDTHSITILDSISGSYKATIYVTSGTIVGQPIISAQTIVVSYQEGGCVYTNTYSTESLAFIQRIQVS